MKFPVVTLIAIFSSALAQAQTPTTDGRQTVCTITINSTEERETFQKSLDPAKFKFVELTSFDGGVKTADRAHSPWFANACKAKVQCDLLVVSAHFGGIFFGSSGYQIPIDTLEQNSCSSTCDGILRKPKEVFLFGCNTLAAKEKDARTQDQYAQVLVEHGIDRSQADRIAETRYGAVGSTFKDRMRRIFDRTPHIYGFSSISPSGANVRPALRRYFTAIPDYVSHIRGATKPTEINEAFKAALSGTSAAQTSGVSTTAGDVGVSFRAKICSAYDEKLTVVQRMQIVADMLMGPDRLIYLNSAVSFLGRIVLYARTQPAAYAILKKIAADPATSLQLKQLETAPSTSNNLRLDLIRLQFQLGKITEAEMNRQTLEIMRGLVNKLDQSSADLLCSVVRTSGLNLRVTLKDFSQNAFKSRAVLSALQCLDTDDQEITKAILPMGRESFIKNDVHGITSYLLALIRLPGYNDKKLDVASEFARGQGGMKFLVSGLRGAAASGTDQLRAIEETKRADPYQSSMVLQVYAALPRNENLAQGLIESLREDDPIQTRYMALQAILNTTPLNSDLWYKVAPLVLAQKIDMTIGTFSKIANFETVPVAMIEPAHRFYQTQADGNIIYAAAILARATLPETIQRSLMKDVTTEPLSVRAQISRWILSQSPRYKTEAAFKKSLAGPAYQVFCEQAQGVRQCSARRLTL